MPRADTKTRMAAAEPSGPCANSGAASLAVNPTFLPTLACASHIDVAEYVELAVRRARSFRHWASGRGMAWEDLVGEASLALVFAAAKFNPAQGRSFTRFASVAIRNALVKAIRLYCRHRSLISARSFSAAAA